MAAGDPHSGRRHPHESHLPAYIGGIMSLEYCKTFADWLTREYPASAENLLPLLRERFKKIKKNA